MARIHPCSSQARIAGNVRCHGRLVILPREAPLTEAHLEALLKLTRMGAIVAPPVPPFYVKPTSLDDVVREIAARTLSWLGLDPGIKMTRWGA